MRRKALIFGVILILLMGFSPILADNAQETVLISKLISGKELAKELRNPDSERIKAFGYLVEFDMVREILDNWLKWNILAALNVTFHMESDEEFIELSKNPPNFERALLAPDFDSIQFEQELSKARLFLVKKITWFQEVLDPSDKNDQKLLRISLDFLKKILNPELFTQGYSQYQIDYFRTFDVYAFARAWAEITSVALDKELIQEISAMGFATEEYIFDKTIDKESEEFKKTVSDYMAKLNAKIEELIQFIENLPE